MKIFNFLRARFRKFINEEQWLKDHVKAGMKIGSGCDLILGIRLYN